MALDKWFIEIAEKISPLMALPNQCDMCSQFHSIDQLGRLKETNWRQLINNGSYEFR